MQGFEHHVDMALCIDITGSMRPVMDAVKRNALTFYADIAAALREKDKSIAKLRVRVIAYRDFYHDGEMALQASDFFTLPEDSEAFEHFVSDLNPDGGGDEPESGLEALALAIKSDWTRAGQRQRHLIVVWTDASAHPLERVGILRPAAYPPAMPANLNELTDLWAGQELYFSAKRLILYAPDSHPWNVIGAGHGGWENTIWYPSKAGSGLDELSYKEIVNAIAHSVG